MTDADNNGSQPSPRRPDGDLARGSVDQAPRLAPRPNSHPAVPEQTTAVFGRPDGVAGAFAPPEAGRTRPAQPVIADPDPVLQEAFSRPEGADTLQRDPDSRFGVKESTPEPADPWRDPDAAAALSAPAVGTPVPPPPSTPGPKLGVSEVLFDRKVSWRALAVLTVIAVVIGLAGGLIGRLTAEVSSPLHSDTVSLSGSDDDNEDEPRSQVARVAQAVEKSVVMIDVRLADGGGTGSGVVIDKEGYIVTNNHVISMAANDRSAKLEVVFSDRTRVPARIVGRDIRTDLAVLKVDGVDNLTVAKLGDSSKIQIGEEVVAFGAPLGLDQTVTSGIVSAEGRAVPLRPDETSDTDAVIDAIQTDAAINPGNSGGPLVDDQGRVIGINTAGLAPGGGSIGLGFAIPVNEFLPIAQALIKDGRVVHAQIGVNASSVRNDRVLGAQVRNVVEGSPAARAGIREGDVITKFGDRVIEDADELTVAVRTSEIGADVPFEYWRDGRTFDATITPASD
ncbi:serine protease [Williamsia sp. 1135]|nr:serine protease [Williamsia sp. 1135]